MGETVEFNFSKHYGKEALALGIQHNTKVHVDTLHSHLSGWKGYNDNEMITVEAEGPNGGTTKVERGFADLTKNLVALPHALEDSAEQVKRQLQEAMATFDGTENLYEDGSAAAAKEALKDVEKNSNTLADNLKARVSEAKRLGNGYLKEVVELANLEGQVNWTKTRGGKQKLRQLEIKVDCEKGALRRKRDEITQEIEKQTANATKKLEEAKKSNNTSLVSHYFSQLQEISKTSKERAAKYQEINSQIDKFYEDKLRELNPENEYRQAKEKCCAAYTTALKANHLAMRTFATFAEQVKTEEGAALKKAKLMNTGFVNFKQADFNAQFEKQEDVVRILTDYNGLRPHVVTTTREEETRKRQQREETERQVNRNIEGNLQRLKTD